MHCSQYEYGTEWVSFTTTESIDSLIVLLLVLKTLRYFQLNKVCILVVEAIGNSVKDLACVAFIEEAA